MLFMISFTKGIRIKNQEYLTSFMTLTGCFLDFLADSTGRGIISGGGISAVRSSSPKMATCWV